MQTMWRLFVGFKTQFQTEIERIYIYISLSIVVFGDNLYDESYTSGTFVFFGDRSQSYRD